MRHLPTLLITTLLGWSGHLTTHASAIKVADVAAFNAAVPNLHPGDTLVLAAGSWRDAQLVFKGTGTEQQPIVLRAERPGATRLMGLSSLRLVGSYLVVSGLDFREGYAPNGGVIEFRDDKKGLANHCRVTECVIDNYNRPIGGSDDKWVHFYGQYNRFDHNYVAGKKTVGVTMVVELPTPESRENHHRIDHNFFGPRPRLGSNAGETIRIGLSETSLTSSRTVVEENYFYHCNGEVEIVSVKSGENVVRRNVFEECEGSVVLRHGNNNLIEGNYFLGNGKTQTGGVRIINAGHKILNNYFADLRGTEFRGALVIMHGVPNSPLNRYSPVHDVAVENNTFVNCSNIELGAGKDAERTQAPANVTLTNNVFYGPQMPQPFHVFEDMSGLKFTHNLLQASGSGPNIAGLEAATFTVQKSADGLLVPVAKGAPKTDIRRPVTAAEAGPRWFRPAAASADTRTGRVLPVATPADLLKAFQTAKANDIIELTQPGIYPVPQTIGVTVPLTLRAKAGVASRPVLLGSNAGQSVFTIENGGKLRLAGVAFDGKGVGAAGLIQSGTQPALEHYSLWANNCAFYGLTDGTGHVFQATTATFADTVQFANCLFYNLAGSALSLATETKDKGTYNAEYVILRNCLFRNVQGSALELYRGGNDESTLGPFLTVDHCTFDNVGGAKSPALMLTGVQWTDIRNSLFNKSGVASAAIKYQELGKSKNRLSNTNFSQSGKVVASYPPRTEKLTYVTTAFAAPQKFDYRLKTPTPQLPVATDGRPVGFVKQ
ncbi:polysaccharide lyase 6 family protein [Hymenobacter artigasi]|uniref:Poly(Beta-D-mannuronate) lyase n=1 Tax=Hymenobacter artigasi TaxID=2719616 RepID=A0ABX1HPP4_9BACT|nr:polysaccharide lyase 6 family protein [Hymenobacter artigasi]NKI90983.1 poly(beta-D-mannuronate) lyase [Hymenobacter artigasi]